MERHREHGEQRSHDRRRRSRSSSREPNERRLEQKRGSRERADRYDDRKRGEHSRRKHGSTEHKSRRSRSPRREGEIGSSDYRKRRYSDSEQRTSEDGIERRRTKDHGRAVVKQSQPLPSQAAAFSKTHDDPNSLALNSDAAPAEKQKPNFAPTGLLAAASNSVTNSDGTAITLKYHEPPEARKATPKDKWKLFVFKGSDILETIELSQRSCWLVGRELAVVDLAAEHPSISKQHAVLQFRYIEKRNEYGDKMGKVKPYLIDLDSANGTMLNKEQIPGSRYLELRDKDMIQFGDSTREYVLMLPPRD